MLLRKKDYDHRKKVKGSEKIISLLTMIIVCFFKFNKPLLAQTIQLGVVKTDENAQQWEEITARLQSLNIDYCTLNFTDFAQPLTLNELNTLFIPNVKTWDYLAVKSLESWLNQGNRVIVSGETGVDSAPAIKTQLRSLLGAYWVFTLSTETALVPVTVYQKDWLNPLPLTYNIKGGVIIPFGLNSHTAAIWNTSGSLPSVVMSDRSVFMGWEWGQDEIAPARLDQAWLKGILTYYGSLPPAQGKTGMSCSARLSQAEEETAQTTETSQNINIQANTPPEIADLPPEITPSTVTPPEANQVNQVTEPQPSTATIDLYWRRKLLTKGEELRGLINRVESTLLTAQAYEIKDNRPLLSEEKGLNSNSNFASSDIINQAKQELTLALELIEQNRYQEAEIKLLAAYHDLLENYPSDRNLAQPEIRYVWLDRGTIVKAKSEEDLIPLFDQFAEAGINIVYLETLNAGYTIYPSAIAPEQNPLVKGWDPLKSAIKLAHARGIELHAWVWVFATANQRHNQILGQPETYLGPVLSQHPDWIITDNKGNLFQPSSKKAFLDPANPEVRSYLLSLFEEIVTQYDVDGLQLDYIRYPFQNLYANDTHGYGEVSRREFFKQTGIDPIKLTDRDPLWQQWTTYRTQQIDSFVATVSQKLKAKKPNLILSTAVFPMPHSERIDKIQQNWEAWIKEGYINLLLPMTYAEDSGGLQSLTNPVFRENFAGSTFILPGLRLQNQSQTMVLDQVQFVRGLPTLGYGLFAAENFNSNIYQLLRRTQGTQSINHQNILPHRQPFETIIQRYQLLQQEWNFWLNQGQLNLDETALKNWQESQSKLTDRFQTLINEPNRRNLLLTQVELSLFKSDFHQWMKDYQKMNSYQVEVWNNRILVLEELLNYGEKFMLTQ
jgi:uncharacterized lipoprotein YddW (UPF0748 family)